MQSLDHLCRSWIVKADKAKTFALISCSVNEHLEEYDDDDEDNDIENNSNVVIYSDH